MRDRSTPRPSVPSQMSCSQHFADHRPFVRVGRWPCRLTRTGRVLQRLLDDFPRHLDTRQDCAPGARDREQAAGFVGDLNQGHARTLAGVDQPPLAVSVPLFGTTVRRNLNEISAVVNGVAGGKAVWTAHPRGASTRIPRVAPETTPWGNSSQSVTGMVNVTPPGSTEVGASPNR